MESCNWILQEVSRKLAQSNTRFKLWCLPGVLHRSTSNGFQSGCHDIASSFFSQQRLDWGWRQKFRTGAGMMEVWWSELESGWLKQARRLRAQPNMNRWGMWKVTAATATTPSYCTCTSSGPLSHTNDDHYSLQLKVAGEKGQCHDNFLDATHPTTFLSCTPPALQQKGGKLSVCIVWTAKVK